MITAVPILIRNPYGGGKQIILDVSVTGINDTTRTNDDKPNQPMDTRFNQKIHKYGQAADQNQLRFIPVIVSYAGEMHKGIINLLLEQIRLKLQLVDGEVKKSKVQAIMKHCARSISAAINRSASRNILLKATKIENGQFGTPYRSKLLLFLFLRPHLDS